MSRFLRRLAAFCGAAALFGIACRDRAITGPLAPRTVSLGLAPRFQAGAESALPISRIRIAAYGSDAEGVVLSPTPLATANVTVNPNDTEWPVALDIPTTGGPVRVVVTLELMHVAIGEAVSIEWAGRTAPIVVNPGGETLQQDVVLGRGGLPNLDVESVTIDGAPATLVIGDSADLGFSLTPAETPGFTVFWGTLDQALGTVTASGRVRAVAEGTARITLTSGLRADTVSVVIVTRLSTVDFITVEAGDGQSAPAGTVVPIAPRVRAYDRGENPVPGVPVVFAVATGGGTIGGTATTATITTDANGNATLAGWTLGTVAGANTLTVTVGALPPETITATGLPGAAANIVVVSGSPQNGAAGTALAQPLVARVRDQFNNAVPNVRVDFATTGGGTLAPVADTSDAQGLVQATWTPGFTTTAQVATATAAGVATPATFNATVTLPPPQVQLALAGGYDKVTLNRTQDIAVTLPTPAPAGGATVTVTSSAPGVLSVAGSGQVTIAAGQTAGVVQVTGLTEGNATLSATSPAYQAGTLQVQVEVRVIGLPTTLNVPFGQTATLPINLLRPAPAGGLTVQVTSLDPSRVSVAVPGVTIPGGATTASATLNGVNLGPTQVIVSHPFYVWDTTAVTTTASLDILNTSYAINESFGATTPVRFLSNGVPVPAPAPGITVNLVARDPACVSVPATVTIPTGLVDVAFAMTSAGGATALPCTTRVVATSIAGIAADSATVTVAAQPSFIVTDAVIGAGLQRSWAAVLGASNHGGTTVRITSPDPLAVLVSPNATTPGSAFIDIPLISGATQANFHVQALEGARGAYAIRASAPGFVDDAGTATVVQPALDISGVSTSTSSLAPDDPFVARIGIPSGQLTSLNELQDVRAGAAPLTATFTTSNAQVALLVTRDSTRSAVTALVTAGNSTTPGSVATGGVAVDAIGNGTATITASIPGFITTGVSGMSTVTVTTPAIGVGNVTVGAGLQRSNGFTLGASQHGGVTVRVESTDPAVALVSPNSTTPGTPFIDVPVADGTVSASFYVQGVENVTGAPGIVVSAPGFAAGRGTATIVRPGIDVSGLTTFPTTLSPDDAFSARLGIPSAGNNALNELQDIRAGSPGPVPVSFVTDVPSVAILVVGAQTGDSLVVNATTGTSSASGIALRPVGAGVTTVRAHAPGFTSVNTVTVTISAPSLTLTTTTTVGAGLMRAAALSLETGNHGGVTVRVQSNSARVGLSLNDQTAGAASIDIPLANGVASATFYVHAIEGTPTTAALSAVAPGFAASTGGAVNVVQPYIDITSLGTTTTTLSPNDDFNVRIGIANATGSALNELQDVRVGATPIPVVTVTTSNAPVAQLVGTSATGTTATATIAPRSSSTLAGSFLLDPLTAGQTTVSASAPGISTVTGGGGAVTVTVSAPAITLGTSTVGSGLQRAASVSLGAPAPAGGLTVRLTSSQPAVALVGRLVGDVGTEFIDVTIPAGGFSASFYLHGVENVTGTPTISATAPGFTNGTSTVPVVQPALDIVSIATSPLASAPDDPFVIRIGIPSANNGSLVELQDIRSGGGTRTVTVNSSSASVGRLVTSTGSGGSVTISLSAGQSQTASSVAAGGVAFDPVTAGSTVVSADIPGFIRTISGGNITVNVQAGLAAIQAAMGAVR